MTKQIPPPLTMTTLPVYVSQTAELLLHLRETNETVTYSDYAALIGLRKGAWHVVHRHQVKTILTATAALATLPHVQCDLTAADFARVVRASNGVPGDGVDDETTIVVTKRGLSK
ncbi:hypothetical protein B0G84_3248 [Paraburkholderia sp. BL8N3]|nr:hypothetical protein [Paraburkholderia sp. BL8N3]TCK37950.1 hypothetical protein B0G84_3248 [Paraburkholderia sp. BL8N3]